jgi:hypothetical protein
MLICCSFFFRINIYFFPSILYGSCPCIMCTELRVTGMHTEYIVSKQHHTIFITL